MCAFSRYLAAALLLALLCACGGNARPDPTPSDPGLSSDPASSDPTPRQVYVALLERFRTEHIFPDGTSAGYDQEERYGGMEENRFAIGDVDGDGREELLLEHNNVVYAGVSLYVYEYTGDQTALRLREVVRPGSLFYPNGLLKGMASHNQTHSDFWPYGLLRYDPAAGTYDDVAYVYACERDVHPGNFPDPADTDGEGIVFYVELYDPETGSYLSADPISRRAYEEWERTMTGGSEPLVLQYQFLTAEAVASAAP